MRCGEHVLGKYCLNKKEFLGDKASVSNQSKKQ